MKTSDLNAGSVYAMRTRQHEAARATMVIARDMWRARRTYLGNSNDFIVEVAPKGTRPERSAYGWSGNRATAGIPCLVIENTEDAWKSYDDGLALTEDPKVILVRAAEQFDAIALLGTFDANALPKRSTKVTTKRADGLKVEVLVNVRLLRPQDLIQLWDSYVIEQAEAKVAKAKQAEAHAERKKENDQQAYEISDRVTTLLGPPISGYNYASERGDLYRTHKTGVISTTYEINQATLLRLLELAEKGAV